MKFSKPSTDRTRSRWFSTGAWVLGGCLLLTTGCASSHQSQPLAVAPAEWNMPVKPFRIFGNIYYVGTAGMASYLVETSAGLILLDCGATETAGQVLQNILQLGFVPGQIKILVGLHGHYDHVGGAALIRQVTGAKVCVGEADRKLVEHGGLDDAQFGNAYRFAPTTVNRGLRDGDTIQLGEVELQVHATPGHTPGTITCTMKTVENGRQGSVIFVGSVSCPQYTLVDNQHYSGVATDFSCTFKTLNSLPCDIFLTEHGWDCGLADKRKSLAAGGSNPFIDPAGYQEYLVKAEVRFDELYKKQSGDSTVAHSF